MKTALLLIALGLGYKVFADATKEQGGLKTLGRLIGLVMIITSVGIGLDFNEDRSIQYTRWDGSRFCYKPDGKDGCELTVALEDPFLDPADDAEDREGEDRGPYGEDADEDDHSGDIVQEVVKRGAQQNCEREQLIIGTGRITH